MTSTPDTATLRAAIADCDPGPFEAELAMLVAARRGKLLTAPDDEILEIDAKIAKARLAIERAQIRRDVLQADLVQAEAAEADAAFRAEYSVIVGRRDALLKSYAGEYAKAARAIAALIEAEQASEREIGALSADDLEFYGLPRPVTAASTAWDGFFLSSGVNLGSAALPPTKNSPALGAFARAPQALQPVLGA